MTPDQIVAFVLALTSPEPITPPFPIVAAGGADRRYAVTMAACPRPLAPFEIEGRTVVCGKVDVPEDHAKPDGRRLKLTFMIFRSHSLAPARDAVVHLHGGPGVGIVERVGLTSTFFDHLRRRRDVVAFDQRGVDASAGRETRCFSTMADNAAAMVGALKGKGDHSHLSETLTKACIEELRAGGGDLAKINTEQNARDVGVVMRTLGYPTYNVYGISYGTKLGLEVMRTAPEGVRAVVLDSVAPPHVPTYDTLATPHAEAIEWIFTFCNEDKACAAAYPNLKQRFWSLMGKLETNPIQASGGKVTHEILFQLIDQRNNHKLHLQGLTGYIPRMVNELEKGETTTFDAVAADKLPPRRTPEAALSGLKGLEPNALVLAQTALRLAQHGRINDEALQAVLERLEADRGATRAGSGLVEEFETALVRAARDLPNQETKSAFASDYLRLRLDPPTAGGLKRLVGRHFARNDRQPLVALIDLMTAQNVAETFARISKDNRKLDYLLLEGFQTMMYACQEDMDINSPAGAIAENARIRKEYLWTESLVALYGDFLKGFYAACTVFPKNVRPGFHQPVKADIPTLVFSGTLDTQTATSWGPETARHLPRGRSIVFPETGHGALAFSQCAKDLGAAFIENPTAPLDTTCVATLKPAFVLPDDVLSRK